MKTSSSDAFTFDDVLILPAPHSHVKSRKEVSTTMQCGLFELELPIFTASIEVIRVTASTQLENSMRLDARV